MNHTYRCLKQNLFELGGYRLLPLRKEDILKIKDWRNRQIDILRQTKPLTDAGQEKYYREMILPTFRQREPGQILFSFLFGEELIGYGGLVHISWSDRRAEISFLEDPDRAARNDLYAVDLRKFLDLIKPIAFKNLKLNRIFTETFDIRPFHVSLLEKNGFRPEGRFKQQTRIAGKFVDSLVHGFLAEYDQSEK